MKNVEKELKLRLAGIKPADFAVRVQSSGGTFLYCIDEHNEYFDRKGTHNEKKEVIRLRKSNKGTHCDYYITFKGKSNLSNGIKTCKEIETSVDNINNMRKILLAMGYKSLFSYRKRRLTFGFEDCKVEIDKIDGIGYFCEIEGPTIKSINRVRNKVAKNLEVEKKGYFSLVSKQRSKNGKRK